MKIYFFKLIVEAIPRKIKSATFFIIALTFIISCKKDEVTPVATTVSSPPMPACKPVPYDLDISITDSIDFTENYSSPWDYGNPTYNDLAQIAGTVQIQSLGELQIYFSEHADTGISSTAHSDIFIGKSLNELYIWGKGTTNFKELFKHGGGPFTFDMTITSGSAESCNPFVFFNLAPITISGVVDIASQTVSLKVKGKTFF